MRGSASTERGFIKIVSKMDRHERARFLMKWAKLFAETHVRENEYSTRFRSTRRPCRVYHDPRRKRDEL